MFRQIISNTIHMRVKFAEYWSNCCKGSYTVSFNHYAIKPIVVP